MPIYLIRWENGDTTLCYARNADERDILVDQWGNPDGQQIFQIAAPVAIDLHLGDDGFLELSAIDERTDGIIHDKCYPDLEKLLMDEARDQGGSTTSQEEYIAFKAAQDARIKAAVESEKKRLWGKSKRCGKRDSMDAPRALRRAVERDSRENS